MAEENDKSVIHELYTDNEQQIGKDVKTITENNGAEKVIVGKLKQNFYELLPIPFQYTQN